ncbi:hypothetical protein LIER_05363 [Lithospermum erythrorhizon]|uniref:Uncharacterized protein n=1 Tax=Lithospermum erythrorhizon TaxID=34254 RepID=A0AAV3P1V7_LITER
MCSIFQCIEKHQKKSKESATISFSLSLELKDITVRIVHPGGREELYRYAIPASYVMRKYPGMFITTPEVFKRPHRSVLSAEDELSPGNKYYLISPFNIRRLTRKYLQRKKQTLPKIKEASSGSEEVADSNEDFSTDSVGSAKNFYYSKCSLETPKAEKKKRPFVPPIQKPRVWKEDWEPSLNSIEEISP